MRTSGSYSSSRLHATVASAASATSVRMFALVVANSASAGPDRATATTGAPASANAPAIPRPKPRLAPTTTVVLPDKSLIIVLFRCVSIVSGRQRLLRALGGADTSPSRDWARPLRPVRRSAGVNTGDDDDRPDHQGAGRGRRRVPRADRAAPSRAQGALLPDARILPGRRGRPPGHAAGRLARPRRVRGAGLDPHMALPDRRQPVPRRASLGQPPPAHGLGHPRG